MRLFERLPANQYHEEPYVKDFQNALVQPALQVREAIDDMFLQLSAHTATWGLSYYEREYGIHPDGRKTLHQRREILYAKMRGRGTSTLQQIQLVADSFYNGSTTIIEHSAEDWFELVFTSHVGIPERLEDLLTIIEEIKPAHLGFEYTVLYNTHEYLSQFPHEFLAGYTQHELRTKKLDNDWEIWKNSHNTHGELRRYPHHYLADFTHQQIRTTRPLAKE